MPDVEFGHYTSPAGLLGIVSDQVLWATNIKFLNDQHEFQHALTLIKKILEGPVTVTPSKQYEVRFQEFRGKVAEKLGFLDPYSAESVFTISFSEQIDLLSQWRGYCPGNNGYCVVFDLAKLHEQMRSTFTDCHMVKCIYDDAVKKTQLKELLNSRWKLYQNLIDDKAKTAVIDGFSRELVLLASYFKHPSFKEEQEDRIVVVDQNDILRSKVEFREGRSTLIPYLKLSAPRGLITKIVVGPNADQPLAVRALEAFMEKCTGVPSFVSPVEIVPSETPYRRT